MKFVPFFDKLTPFFTANQNISVATMDLPFKTKKCKPTEGLGIKLPKHPLKYNWWCIPIKAIADMNS